MNEINLQNSNGQIVVSSRDVAENFGKRHQEVLYAIEGRKCDCGGKKDCKKCKGRGYMQIGILQENEISVESHLSKMFAKTQYKDSMNRTKHEYLMNRDGFSLLAMGFTGKKALEWKLKYIEAFNKMEEAIKQGNYLSEEEKLKLQLFSKDSLEVVNAHNRLVELATAPLIAENEELRPKAEFHDTVHSSVNSISVGKFSGVLQKNEIFKRFGRNKLFQWLRDNDYLCVCGDLKNKPTQKALSGGYMDYDEYVTDNGHGKSITTYKPLITGKGQTYFTEKLIRDFQKE